MPIVGTISTAGTIPTNSFNGPFLINGKFYIIYIASSSSYPNLYSSNDGVTWARVAGTTGTPLAGLETHSVWSVITGDDIFILSQRANGEVALNRYTIGSNTWVATVMVQGAVTTATPRGACSLVKTPNGLVAFFQGPQYTSMGTSYAQIYYSRSSDNGATWTAPALFSGGTASSDIAPVAIAGDTGWRSHVTYVIGTAPRQRTLYADGVTLGGIGGPLGITPVSHPARITPVYLGETYRLRAFVLETDNTYTFMVSTDADIVNRGSGTPLGVDDTLHRTIDSGITDDYAARSGTNETYRVLPASNGALYFYKGTHSTSSTSNATITFSAFSTPITGTYQRAHCNIYTKANGDVVLGYIAYNDVNTLFYGEELIQAGAAPSRLREWKGAAAQRVWLGAANNAGVLTGKPMV